MEKEIKFVDKKSGEVFSWNKMVLDFTTEATAGEISDEELSEMTDEEFIGAVEKYTDFVVK